MNRNDLSPGKERGVMQKNVNSAGLCCSNPTHSQDCDWLLASWNLNSWNFLKRVPLPTWSLGPHRTSLTGEFICTMWLWWTPASSLGPGAWLPEVTQVLYAQEMEPDKNLQRPSSAGSQAGEPLHLLSHITCCAMGLPWEGPGEAST